MAAQLADDIRIDFERRAACNQVGLGVKKEPIASVGIEANPNSLPSMGTTNGVVVVVKGDTTGDCWYCLKVA